MIFLVSFLHQFLYFFFGFIVLMFFFPEFLKVILQSGEFVLNFLKIKCEKIGGNNKHSKVIVMKAKHYIRLASRALMLHVSFIRVMNSKLPKLYGFEF